MPLLVSSARSRSATVLVLLLVCCGLVSSSHPRRRTSLRSFLDRFAGDGNSIGANGTSTACISDDAAFRKAVLAAPDGIDPKKPGTVITICSRVKISNIKGRNNSTGINISNKNIDLKCYNPRVGARCVMDGQRASRILYGEGAALRATMIDFINAYTPVDPSVEWPVGGSALSFVSGPLGKSRITLIRCSFRNNRNDGNEGGAVYISNSFLTISATPESQSIFSGNNGTYGSAMYLRGNANWTVKTGNVIFSNNTAKESSAVYWTEVDCSIKGVTFRGNRGKETSAVTIDYGFGNWGGDPDKIATLEDVKFIENTASGVYGTLYVDNSPVNLTGVSFTGNSAKEHSGLVARDSVVDLDAGTFNSNKATVSSLRIHGVTVRRKDEMTAHEVK